MQIVEHLQVLAFRNLGISSFAPSHFHSYSPLPRLPELRDLQTRNRVVGNVWAATGSREDMLNGQQAFCPAVVALVRFLVFPQPFEDGR